MISGSGKLLSKAIDLLSSIWIEEKISNILENVEISYVKWDMNRNITNIPESKANSQKNEFYHRLRLSLIIFVTKSCIWELYLGKL